MRSFPKSVSLFLFCKFVHMYHIFLDSTYKQYHMIFVFLCLTSLVLISKSIYIAANGIISFFF